MRNLPVYIITANKTMKALQAFSYLFNKFWSDNTQVNVLGYDIPDFNLPGNFNYISLGTQRGKNYWSDDMKDYFSNHCKDELFILTFEDVLILDTIDKNLLKYATEFCKLNNEKLLRFNLSACLQSRGHNLIKSYDEFDVIEAKQDEIFRLALNISIWNRTQFLNKLVSGETMHDFENPSKPGSKNDGLGVYAFKKKYVVRTGEAYRRGKKCPNPYKDLLSRFTLGKDLDKKHIKVIEENNWLPEI